MGVPYKLRRKRDELRAVKKQNRVINRIAVHGAEPELYRKAADLGLSLAINNHATHWVFRGNGFAADWWPKRGRLVFNFDFDSPAFTTDFDEALRLISRYRTMAP